MFGMFGATLLLSLREIRRHLMRSFLTTLGIIIGVASVITMVTLGNGATASIQQQISSLGSNVFIVFPVPSESGVRRPFDQARTWTRSPSQIAGVVDVAGSVTGAATAFHNGQDWSTKVDGRRERLSCARSRSRSSEGRGFTVRRRNLGQECLPARPQGRTRDFRARAPARWANGCGWTTCPAP